MRVAWYVPMGWEEYRSLSVSDRRALIKAINDMREEMDAETELASKRGRR